MLVHQRIGQPGARMFNYPAPVHVFQRRQHGIGDQILRIRLP